MRVFITGITGFVGSHLADYLLEHHPALEVHGSKRWRSPMDNVYHLAGKVAFHDLDLRDYVSVVRAIETVRPDVVIHLAAQSFVPFSYQAPADTLHVNAIGTCNLLESIRQVGIDPFLHICSSSEVYGQVRPEEVPIREDCPLRPVSPYGVSKVAEDMLAYQYFVAYGLKTVRTRMFTHTGPRRGDVFVASFFAKQIASIEAGVQEPVLRVGNLDSVRTFADVRDTVRAYWIMVEKFYEGSIPAGEVYNIGGNRTMTVREMLQFLLSLSPEGKRIRTRVDKALLRPADVTLQIPCVDKFKAATGWEPTIPFEQTMEDLLNYWRDRLARLQGQLPAAARARSNPPAGSA